jgi:electron transport complex protein RnfC
MWSGFHGGVHPPESKVTSGSSIEILPLPKKVVVPLSQHTGAPAKAVVKAGDTVRTGQLIAEAAGFISAGIHSPVSGTVTAIDIHLHPAGFSVESIIIESDEKDEKAEFKPGDPESLDPGQVADSIKNAGIVGLGGAAFPTHVKLSPPKTKTIDTAILNGCECEPYLTCDHRVMVEDTEKVLGGFRLIMKVLGVGSGIIAVEDNKKDALARFKAVLKPSDGIRIAKLRTKYPQGAEKQLIRSLLGREVPSGKLPLDVGCVVQNVQTSKAIYEAVAEGKPLYERVVTVTGGIKKPMNVKVRIGTLLTDLLEYCGGFAGDVKKVVAGGPMMGTTLTTLEVPVIKGMSGIVVLTGREAKTYEPSNCIKCATCVRSCPMGLVPCMILRLVEKGRNEELKEYRALDCIECGTCSYGCPAKIHLVQNIKRAKVIVQSLSKKG